MRKPVILKVTSLTFCSLSVGQEMQVSACVRARSVISDSLWPYARLLCPWDSPGKNTGVGCHFLLQGIFPTQGSNPCLPQYAGDSL